MKSMQTKLVLRATYDQYTAPSNLARWKVAGGDKCRKMGCSEKGTLAHILSNSRHSLSRKTWRHNHVLRVLEKVAVV